MIRKVPLFLALLTTLAVVVAPAHAAAGDLDTTFGGTGGPGKATRALGTVVEGRDAAIVDGTGRMVVAGVTDNDPVLWGLTADGSSDTTFGTPEGGGSRNTIAVADLTDPGAFNAVAVAPDGTLIAVGHRDTGSEQEALLAAFEPDGDRITTNFGPAMGNGYGSSSFGGAFEVSLTAVEFDSSGNIIVAGYADGQMVVARFTEAGVLDTTFNTTGYNVLPNGGTGRQAKAQALVVDGSAIYVGGAESVSVDTAYHRIDKLTSGGALDLTWAGSTGQIRFRPSVAGGETGIQALLPDGSGGLIAGGVEDLTGPDKWAILHVASDGGMIANNAFAPAGQAGQLRDLAFGPSGVYGAGTVGGDFGVARFVVPGLPQAPHLDSGFASGTVVVTDLGGTDAANAVVVGPSGKPVAAGTGAGKLAATRYLIAAGGGGTSTPPVPSISVADAHVTEGNAASDGRHAELTVSLSEPTTVPVTFTYSTANGSANGDDFDALTNEPVEFPPGVTSQTIAVGIKEDTAFENDETFIVSLGNVVHATAGDTSATVTIKNDDAAPKAPPKNDTLIPEHKIDPLPDATLRVQPAPVKLKEVPIPDVSAGSTNCKNRFCTIDQARAILAKGGVRNYRLREGNGDLDEVPRSLRDDIEHGDVIQTNPGGGRAWAEPNVAAYPNSPLPDFKFLTYKDPKMSLRCDHQDLAAELTRSPALWPGETTGKGRNRRWGAEDLLKRLKCGYRVTYSKQSGVTTPTITRVKPDDDTVRVYVAMPKTVELQIVKDEGPFHPKLVRRKLPGLLADGSMPVTGDQLGGFVARVFQTTSAPSLPVKDVNLVVTDPRGNFVATGKTGPDGSAELVGYFLDPGTHTIVATKAGDNGLSVDGSETFQVRARTSAFETQSGRNFLKKAGKWVFQAPTGGGAPIARAAQAGSCNPGENRDVNAGFTEFALRSSLVQVIQAKNAADRAEWTGRFINKYLGAREAGLLDHKVIQTFLSSVQANVANAGDGALKAVTSLCDNPTVAQARGLARGYDVKSAPLPVVEASGSLLLPDGKIINNAFTLGGSAGDFVLAPPAPAPGQLRLSVDERVLVLEAVISTGGGNVTQDMRDAMGGVIATGGGNVISTGGGNIISTDGASLTDRQKAAIGRVISTGGGNMTPQQREALQVISTGGGNLISDKGLGLVPGDVQLAALQGVISTGGGNLTGDRLRVVQAVIATGGGNVISTGGGNLRDVLLPFVNGVISTGGGNLAAQLGAFRNLSSVISTGGGNLIGQAGGNLIGQAGGN